MHKFLPLLLAATVFLTPLYPVYAQKTIATSPAKLRLEKAVEKKDAMVEKAQDKMATAREKMASRSAALKEKLAKFKDKIKANRVEKISTNLNEINARRTANMQQALEKISNVLENLKNKTSEAATAGKDVSSINNAIANAESEWAQADAAVKSQMEKDYSIVVNTEKTVKEDASIARNSLRDDLKATHTQLVEVRQALAKAISTAVSSIKGGNNGSN